MAKIKRVRIHLCEPCLNGEGGTCDLPCCALWGNARPEQRLEHYEEVTIEIPDGVSGPGIDDDPHEKSDPASIP